MQLIALILANALFLALICLGVLIERRVSKLEARHGAAAPDESGDPREKEAEARFTQGVANILGYEQGGTNETTST